MSASVPLDSAHGLLDLCNDVFYKGALDYGPNTDLDSENWVVARQGKV